MTVSEIITELKSRVNEKVRAYNIKFGADSNQFGVKMGDLRSLAKTIKTNHQPALALWETENAEARLLATLLRKPHTGFEYRQS
ncbi:MAG: DNA alkylation repair protein [Bacteroidales bacterium]|nr:DNA alkylation repair protein [Bacteroidales bacterium]